MDDNNNNNDELICPITYELFHDPVRANDGHTYEREAITEWIKQNGTSPFTRQILHVEDLSTDNHLKDLTEQYRNSKGISTISTDSIGSSSHCYISRKIHPRESNQIEQRITQNSECRKRSWVLVFCIITIITGILCLSIIFIITTNRESNKQLEPSILSSTSYPLYSRKTTLLQINNKTRFNYTYYSYSYTAISSHDMIKFSFHPDLSSWCLDDVSVISIRSKMNLIHNGGFENGLLKPFYLSSKQNSSLSNILPENADQHSGRYAFCYNSIFNINGLIQNLNTTKGQIYNISFWIKNRNGIINQLNVSMIS